MIDGRLQHIGVADSVEQVDSQTPQLLRGKTVGFVRFEGTVQEIFDVQILPVGAAFVLPEAVTVR